MLQPISTFTRSIPKRAYNGVKNIGAQTLGIAKQGKDFFTSKVPVKQISSNKEFLAGAGVVAAGVASLAAIGKTVADKIQEAKEQ